MIDAGKSSKCAVLFGASGGIGGALARMLVQRCDTVWTGSRSGAATIAGCRPFQFDLEDEASIAVAAHAMQDAPPDLIVVASGILNLPEGPGPERSYRRIDADAMQKVFRINAIGPALVAKHMLPLMPRDRRGVFAALSARVGSIGDNRLGGWHSYRASKAALNMLLANFAIELARTHPHAVVCGLHPGTVDTALSEPFQANLPEGQLLSPAASAKRLLAVMDRLQPCDSGGVYDWKGERVPA